MHKKKMELPLHDAVIAGDADLVDALIRRGANVNKKNFDGETPLLISTLLENMKVVEKLVNAGADVNLKDNKGNTALQYALNYLDDLNIARILIEAGGNVDVARLNGSTALHFAALHNNVTVIEYLLRNGMDANTRDDQERTPLHLAGIFNKGSSHLGLVETLLKSRADVTVVDGYDMTPLEYLARNVDEKGKNEYCELFRRYECSNANFEACVTADELVSVSSGASTGKVDDEVDYNRLLVMMNAMKEEHERRFKEMRDRCKELEQKIHEVQEGRNMIILFILLWWILFRMIF